MKQKKGWPVRTIPFSKSIYRAWSARFLNLAGADAAGADLDGSNTAVLHCTDTLQVRFPGGAGFVVCVTDVITGNRLFAADFTFSCHFSYSSRIFRTRITSILYVWVQTFL